MKKKLPRFFFIVLCLITIQVSSQPIAVTKTNPTKVYVHYMPWFTAPENPGSGVTNYPYGATGVTNEWGAHWSKVTSNTANPNTFTTVTDYTGVQVQTRNICAHYHPLIGPYDGKDTSVLEYHLLLMKLSGIDGVMIDWYGQTGTNGDVTPLLTTSNALIAQTPNVGLKFGLVMEDNFWGNAANTIPISTYAVPNGNYAVTNYFNNPQYIKLGDMRAPADTVNQNAPLVCVFGPQHFKTPGQWNTILQGNTAAFLPLFNQSAPIGTDAGGEFVWPDPQAGQGGNPPAWYSNTSNYYSGNGTAIHNRTSRNVVLGTAYQGFNDFYGNGGADQLGIIPRTYGPSGNTLTTLFALDNTYKSSMDGIQIATWNDYSEGTIIEPTVEFGFASLDTIQKFTGVPYTEADLKQVYRFFTLRKKYVGDTAKQLQLNQVFNYFVSLLIPNAVALMDTVDNININAPTVSILSSGSPSENGATGQFIISGTNVISNTTVYYTVSGTRPAMYYTASPALSDSVILTPAMPSDTITIAAVDDTIIDPKETVVLTLNTDSTYNIDTTSATLTIIDNEIPPCSGPIIVNAPSAPTIDGAADAIWSKAPTNVIAQTISGVIQTGSTWQGMYDSVNLYLLVQVKDSNLSNIGTNVWDQDGVEVYIAGNNSKVGPYTVNDHQYRFNWNVLPWSIANITGNTGPTTGIVYAIPTTIGGYTLEVSIPWTTIGGTAPFNGKEIGFDINLNDQQNNFGQREATAGWNGSNSDNYMNTASFGTVDLTICTGGTTLSAPVISSVDTANGNQGSDFNYFINASNTPTSYGATGLPAGLTIDTATGIISGIPTVPGVFNVTITAANSVGTDSEVLAIGIAPTPVITGMNTVYGKEDSLFSYTIIASNTPTNYGAMNLPAGLTIDTATGIISGMPAMFGTFNSTITATNTAGTYSKPLVIIIDSTPAVLYISVNASRQPNATVAIQWMVDSEVSIKQYEVQRSADSINFTTIYTDTSIGNNNIDSVLYNATDASPSSGVSYYRIKGTSLYDSSALFYSTVVTVNKINATSVYPNPLSGNTIYIPFDTKIPSTYTLRLVNTLGQTVFTKSININAGSTIYDLQLTKKPAAGYYQLQLINDIGAKSVYKILIENN